MLVLDTKQIWLKKWAFDWKIRITISVLESLAFKKQHDVSILQVNETSFMSLNKKMLTILLKLFKEVSYERTKNNIIML